MESETSNRIRCNICNSVNPQGSKVCSNCNQEIDYEEVKKVLGVVEQKPKDKWDKIWDKFSNIFWMLVALKTFISYFVLPVLITEGSESVLAAQVALIVMLLVVVGMIVNIGWYTYSFSGNKKYLIYSALGSFWLGGIGIFIAYFAVQNEYRKKKGKLVRNDQSVIFLSLAIILNIFLLLTIIASFDSFDMFSVLLSIWIQPSIGEW